MDAVVSAVAGFYGPVNVDSTKVLPVAELVLSCAVQGDANRDVVAAITSLPTAAQSTLAEIIQDVMEQYGGAGSDASEAGSPARSVGAGATASPAALSSFKDKPRHELEDELKRLMGQVVRLCRFFVPGACV